MEEEVILLEVWGKDYVALEAGRRRLFVAEVAVRTTELDNQYG